MRAPPSDLPIVFEQVSLQASDVTVLRSVSLALGSGAPTALIGPNGAGKTTLIRLAASLTAPTSGHVTWGGKPETDGRRIAVVFQRPVMLRRSAAAPRDVRAQLVTEAHSCAAGARARSIAAVHKPH